MATHMSATNRIGVEISIAFAMLDDVQHRHCELFTLRDLRNTKKFVERRLRSEGISFLTKTLPRLGKCLDKALALITPLDATKERFKTLPNSKLPRFLGELFKHVIGPDGFPLVDANIDCIRSLRDILYCWYKYKLPYDDSQEHDVVDQFVKTEDEIAPYDNKLSEIADIVDCNPWAWGGLYPPQLPKILRRARRTIQRVFRSFDHEDICPRHGPGAVSTGERNWNKYLFRNIPDRVADQYPIDAYFYASVGHVCDSVSEIKNLGNVESPARVLLVPKDSRGPRLISCEPLYLQWLQQGLGGALIRHIERHPFTRDHVRFEDQSPNQIAALTGSQDGRYATLDLKEASDRVSIGLVRALFSEPLLKALLSVRSLSTRLPNGKVIKLRKYAPMGSALCFPIMAITIWSLLDAAFADAYGRSEYGKYSRDRIYVYGDDVIVPSASAEYAMSILESFGLKINRDKSYTKGLFRESCGMDAYKGQSVTPVRFRTPWKTVPSPEAYPSWIQQCNQLYDKQYFRTYDLIVGWLLKIYKEIPCDDMYPKGAVLSLREVPETNRPKTRRLNSDLQRLEYKIWHVRPRKIRRNIRGWSMLLRWFAEAGRHEENSLTCESRRSGVDWISDEDVQAFSVRSYTIRNASKLVRVWR